jgi:hypothetical protein
VEFGATTISLDVWNVAEELHPAGCPQLDRHAFEDSEAKHSMPGTKSGRKRESTRREYESFIFRVENPRVSYGLYLDRNGRSQGPYWEHLELSLRGTIVVPDRVQGREGSLTFLGNRRLARDLDNPSDSRSQPVAVGELTIWGETTSYLGSLPQDELWHIFSTLNRGEFQMVVLHGEKLYRGKAKILDVHFEREIDLAEW